MWMRLLLLLLLSLNPRDWTLLTGPSQPTPMRGQSVGFDFGTWVGANDSYLYLPAPILTGYASLSVSFTITTKKTPVFRYDTEPGNTCGVPATTRPWIARRGWEAGDPTYRWWSNPAATVLAAGSFGMSVPLDASQWSDVDGHSGSEFPDAFAAALQDPAAVGLSFGGGCFFGHGVFVSGGTAHFTLTDYRLN